MAFQQQVLVILILLICTIATFSETTHTMCESPSNHAFASIH